LKPVRNKDTWAIPLAGVLSYTLKSYYDSISMKPRIVPVSSVSSALERALSSGTIVLRGGKFTGSFNAATSKELREIGAKYESRFSGWYIPITLIPSHLVHLALRAQDEQASWRARIDSAVSKSQPLSVIGMLAIPIIYRTLASQVSKAITDTTGIEVTAPTNHDESMRLMDQVEAAVREFSEKESKRISKILQTAAADGWTGERLSESLAGRVGMAVDRAKAMAEKSMAIAATDLKAQLYPQAGFPRYRWETQHDSKVRSDHQLLDGGIFDWANPPLVNSATGAHAHPGQDNNCRCVAIPLED
jgi:SPP1 gp7 family putative phage head morphogenesis protein